MTETLEVLAFLAAPCLLTVVIETVFFVLFGYRGKDTLIVLICTNILTNVALNITAAITGWEPPGAYLAEIAVVAVEYAIFARAFGPSKKLFWLTLAANALTFALGLVIFHH